ncbi:MAG TPA: FAD-binding oxidoreductase, partial [Fimbriimonadaceae bacterium]|nr:FAD-binding oxidoreductase [Fimbriimonadaceae bacterium]
MSLVLPLQSLRRISGFGRSEFYDGYVFKPQSPEEILGIFEVAREAERQVVLRAAGRSYGDPAVGRECVICDFTGMSTIHDFNPEFGFVEVDPGVTLETIWRTTLPQGWWLPVVSGTTKITVGGALAMNIHGKNNYVRGTLGEHVSQVDFLTTDGRLLKLGPDDPLFTSVFSTAGLLGAITRVKLQLKKVSSGNVHVKAISCANLQEQFETFERFEGDAEYCVSWVDCCARGRAKGRGLFHAGWHPEKPDAHSLQDQDLPEQIMGFFPKSKVWKILRWLN